MTERAFVRWLLSSGSPDPLERALEPLVRTAMIVGVLGSVVTLVTGLAFTADTAAYWRYALTSTPVQVGGLLVSLAVLQRRGLRSGTRVFAGFVTTTLLLTSAILGATAVSGGSPRLLIPTIVVTLAFAWTEAAAWVTVLLAAAWASTLHPDFATLTTHEHSEILGRLAMVTLVIVTATAILIVLRIALRRAIAEATESARLLARAQRIDSLGRLAAGTAHDFNGLLGGLLLSLEEIRIAGTAPEREESLAGAEGLVRQARDLSSRLLAFARGDRRASNEVFDVRAVVDEAIAASRPALGPQVRLDWRPGEHPARVRGNPVEIRQVVTNLLLNAADAVAHGGRVTVEVAREPRPAGLGDGAWVRVSVLDDGPGVALAIRDQLFEPFVTTKGQGRGTGLGLTTSHAIAHRHGGTLTLEPGDAGAHFALRLPEAMTA